ncbi:MAG: hypothetical protein WCP21_17080 [Armatimonadota bacterium]
MGSTDTAAILRGGVAKSDITVSDPAILVHDPLFAKVLVLTDGDTTLAIIAMDVVAIGMICDVRDDFLPKVRARIESELGIPGHHVLVNASHSHPPGRTLCDPDELVERVFDAVRRAALEVVPVQIGAGSGYEDRFAINRTLRMKDGTGWTIRHANPCPPDEAVAGLGPLDPEIGVLRVDRTDGAPLAVVYNYACHPLMGFNDGGITANFPGVASQAIEETLGDGVLALFLQGAGGDVCDVLYKDTGQPSDMRPFGMMLGLSTLKAWNGIETGASALKIITETVELPRRTDIPARLAALEQEQAELLASLRGTSLNFRTFLPLYLKYALNPDFPSDYSYRYLHNEAAGSAKLTALDLDNRGFLDKYLHNIRAMERLAHIQDDLGTLRGHQAFNEASGETTFTAEVMGLRIGDFVLITCPAEVLTQIGLNVKQASPHPHTFMAAFSNGYAHYGPPADEYPMGGYEVTECFLGAGWQELYEQKAAEILSRL